MSDTTVVLDGSDDLLDVTPPVTSEELDRPRAQHAGRWYALVFAVGTVFATLLFAWTLTGGSFDFDRRVGEMFSAQLKR